MSKLFEEMAQGTAEPRAFMEGEREGYKVTLRMLSACRWTPCAIESLAVETRKRQRGRFLW
jgi:hypothetical protein